MDIDWAAIGDSVAWGDVLAIAIIIVAALVGIWLARRAIGLAVQSLIAQRIDEDESLMTGADLQRRMQTLQTLASRLATVVIALIALLMILSKFQVDIGPAIAGFGVLGIAIGFGAQTLVRDWLSGIFIVLENQYSVGDVVSIAGVDGVVEGFSLRRTVLRNLDGTVHNVPNGQIVVASNMTRGWARVNLDVSVAYDTDIDRASAVIDRIGQELQADPGLARVARAHALDMLERGYIGHVGPDGRDVGERVGILYRRFIGGAGENLAEQEGIDVARLADQTGPLAAKLMDGWMSSPGHRRNILEPDYTHMGLAAAGRGDRLLVVQVFGRRAALLAKPIPLEVEKGARLPLEVEPGSTAQAPQKFAFAPPGTATDELVTLDLSSNEVVVEPGQYRLEFFLPTGREGYFSVADGPLLVVRKPAG